MTTTLQTTVRQVPGFVRHTVDNCSIRRSSLLPRIANYPPTDNDASHVFARSHYYQLTLARCGHAG